MRTQLFEQDVGGNFEDDVGDEENDKRCIKAIISGEVEVGGQTKEVCIGDVHSRRRQLLVNFRAIPL